MIAAGRTVQAVTMPIVDHDMPARMVVKTLTTMEPAKFIPVIAVEMPTPAILAPIGPAVRAIAALCTPIGTMSRPVELPMNLAVDLTFDPVATTKIAVSRLGDRGSGAEQRYGQGRSDDRAHPHCLSPFLCRSQYGHGLYASSTLDGSWGIATEPPLTGNVRIRSGKVFSRNLLYFSRIFSRNLAVYRGQK
jgi:hypothetical protein